MLENQLEEQSNKRRCFQENETGESLLHKQHCDAEIGTHWTGFERFQWFKCFTAVGRERKKKEKPSGRQLDNLHLRWPPLLLSDASAEVH